MRILITGGTGLIGRALCDNWQRAGHELWVLSRNPSQVPALCSGARGIARLQELDGSFPLDAVINLAGAPSADRRWTAARRDLLWRSRVHLTRTLIDSMANQSTPPAVLLSASAVGWYGNGGDVLLDESSPRGIADFGSHLCQAWEQEANRATTLGIRVATLRIAPVLSPKGGMLARMAPPFRLGLGAQMGSGEQWMPWIHLDDLVRLFDYLLHHSECKGVYNACAPEQVRNSDFTQMLARALRRPAVLRTPSWALRLALGKMSILLLGGQRLIPRRAQEAGFVWRHPNLAGALERCFS